MEIFRRVFRDNTAGLSVTATNLIFIPQNKEQQHHTKTNGATELHSV